MAPASLPADEQRVRDAAMVVMDSGTPFSSRVLESVVLQSDIERRFAAEMLKAMRAERQMFRRVAIAVDGSEKGQTAKRVELIDQQSREAIEGGTVTIQGEAATLLYAPAGGRSTTLSLAKHEGVWRLDLLRRYRERGQINAEGIARWQRRQRAAEMAAELYEKKEERDFAVLPTLYEAFCQTLPLAVDRGPATAPTTRP